MLKLYNQNSINEKWVGDITYIHTIRDGWCYLALVLDLLLKNNWLCFRQEND